jgi:hypothetical protein
LLSAELSSDPRGVLHPDTASNPTFTRDPTPGAFETLLPRFTSLQTAEPNGGPLCIVEYRSGVKNRQQTPSLFLPWIWLAPAAPTGPTLPGTCPALQADRLLGQYGPPDECDLRGDTLVCR